VFDPRAQLVFICRKTLFSITLYHCWSLSYSKTPNLKSKRILYMKYSGGSRNNLGAWPLII